jgi:hypothetical protein
MKKYSLLLFLTIVFACSKNTEPKVELISTRDANKLMEVIITPDGGVLKQGEPPAPSVEKGKIELTIQANNSSNNQQSTTSQQVNTYQNQSFFISTRYECSTTPWDVGSSYIDECDYRKKNLKNRGTPYCIFRIKGSNNYKIFEYSKYFGSSGTLNFPLQLPENIDNGEFEAEFSIVDEFGLVTNYVNTKVVVKRIDDKDNPSKAFGCNFEKASSELIVVLNNLTTNPSPINCEQFKIKYNEIANAIFNCKNIPEKDKIDLRKANTDLQSIDCSDFGVVKAKEFSLRINSYLK